MLTKKMARFSAVAIVVFACVLATEARGQLASALTAPLSCTVPFGSGTLTIQAGADGLLFPHDVPCPGGTGTCSEYTYRFTSSTGSTLSQSFLSVSSDLDIYVASPAGNIEVTGPNGACAGDDTTKIGVSVCEQRQVRFNSNASTLDATLVVTRAAPRVSTAGSRSGNKSAFCLIQGPGVPGGAFTPYSPAAILKLGGGKLDVSITYGADGRPVAGACVAGQANPCFSGIPEGDLVVNGEVLRDFDTVTFGDNTTTCIKGNPTRCYCTKAPCP